MVLRAVRAFLALQRHGTVAAAAEEVHLSPAAVSVQLKVLEERLGVALFQRTKRSLSLSPAGQRLVPLAEKMMSVYDDMLSLSEARAVHGRLTLGVINSALSGIFPAVLRQLKAQNPQLEVRLVAGISPHLMAQVEAGLLDAAVITQPPRHASTNLMVHHLYTEPIALVAPKGMHCSGVADAMARAPYVAFDRSTWVGQAIDAFLLDHRIRVRPSMELNSQHAVLAVVRHGLGVSILPMLRGASQDTDGLRIMPITDFERGVALVEHRTHTRSHLTAKLLGTIAEVAEAVQATHPRKRGQPSRR